MALLDSKHRIIAESSGSGFGSEFKLKANGRAKDSYREGSGHLVVFAKTIGYEEYDGLGWYGVITQTD